MIRPRPATTADRIAISRVRPAVRAKSRLATLAHAIRSTSQTATSSAHAARRASGLTAESIADWTRTPIPRLVPG